MNLLTVYAASRYSVRDAKPAIKAVEGMGIEVDSVTDLQKIMEYGAMSMPALVINEKLVSAGKTLKPAEISELIENFVKN